jgi:hypothetical protein
MMVVAQGERGRLAEHGALEQAGLGTAYCIELHVLPFCVGWAASAHA